MTIYKLSKSEFMQALADYLTKKYDIHEKVEATTDVQIDGVTGSVIIEVKTRG